MRSFMVLVCGLVGCQTAPGDARVGTAASEWSSISIDDYDRCGRNIDLAPLETNDLAISLNTESGPRLVTLDVNAGDFVRFSTDHMVPDGEPSARLSPWQYTDRFARHGGPVLLSVSGDVGEFLAFAEVNGQPVQLTPAQPDPELPFDQFDELAWERELSRSDQQVTGDLGGGGSEYWRFQVPARRFVVAKVTGASADVMADRPCEKLGENYAAGSRGEGVGTVAAALDDAAGLIEVRGVGPYELEVEIDGVPQALEFAGRVESPSDTDGVDPGGL